MILSILLELHIFNKDINIVNSAKRKKMVLKSFLTLNCNYSNKVKNCQGAGRFILKKRFTRSLTVNKHFFFGGREGTGWPYEKGKVFKTAVSQQTADLVTWSHLLKKSLIENFIFCEVTTVSECFFIANAREVFTVSYRYIKLINAALLMFALNKQ